MFLQYAIGTPFINWYYSLCGMYIGRNVYINSTRISEFDLVILEDEVCIDEGATLCGHAFEDGVMKLGDVLVRQYTTIGAWSVINPYAEVDEGSELGPFSLVAFGSYIPPETKYQGSPATQVSARPFEEHDVGPLYYYSCYIWTIPFIIVTWLVTTAVFYCAAFGNIRLLVYIADRYSFFIAGGFLPIGLLGMGLSQTVAGIVIKRILLGRAFPGTYRVYGSYYLRRWAVQQVSNLSLLVTLVVSSTSLASWYYSVWGATVGKGTEIMMIPTLCDSDLVSVGRSSFLGSETRFLCSQVKDGAMHCEMIHIGSYTFVGNNTCVVGNAFVSDDVVVGSMTLLDAEVYPPGSTLVGSPCIQLGLRPPIAEAPDHVGRFARAALDWFIIISTLIVLSVALAPPIVFLYWLNDRVNPLVLGALFPPVFSWFFITVFIFAITFKWILVGHLDTQPHHAASFQRQCSFFIKSLLGILGLVATLFYGTGIIAFCLRCLGARVGRRTCINTLYVDDWDLISIGNDVYPFSFFLSFFLSFFIFFYLRFVTIKKFVIFIFIFILYFYLFFIFYFAVYLIKLFVFWLYSYVLKIYYHAS
jgi:acetyltransferase-like isoleucine patch superfamily enzyme